MSEQPVAEELPPVIFKEGVEKKPSKYADLFSLTKRIAACLGDKAENKAENKQEARELFGEFTKKTMPVVKIALEQYCGRVKRGRYPQLSDENIRPDSMSYIDDALQECYANLWKNFNKFFDYFLAGGGEPSEIIRSLLHWSAIPLFNRQISKKAADKLFESPPPSLREVTAQPLPDEAFSLESLESIIASVRENLENMKGKVSERDIEIIKMRFGINNGKAYTHEEIGEEFDISKQRVSQIELKMLKKMGFNQELIKTYQNGF